MKNLFFTLVSIGIGLAACKQASDIEEAVETETAVKGEAFTWAIVCEEDTVPISESFFQDYLNKTYDTNLVYESWSLDSNYMESTSSYAFYAKGISQDGNTKSIFMVDRVGNVALVNGRITTCMSNCEQGCDPGVESPESFFCTPCDPEDASKCTKTSTLEMTPCSML